MEVYQVIYTSVEHSLSDTELGLTNGPGLKTYSCSEGLTRENLDEIARFCSYRLPKNNTKEYSQVVGDPQVPEQFPKIFRTLRLSDGRMAAIQSCYAGVDHQGQEGNFFAHALVFDNYDSEFFPERYYKNSVFRTYLTADEAEKELVKYLPEVENLEVDEEHEKAVFEFIAAHKRELSYIINQSIKILAGSEFNNLCIVTDSEEDTAMYLVALKYLLPRDLEENLGISTYNVYLPSNRQEKIVFHGTINGQNNITPEAIEYRKNCVYINVNDINTDEVQMSPLLQNWDIQILRKEYSEIKIKSVEALLNWVAAYENTTKPGMGSKLLRLKASVGEAAFIKRANEIYPLLQKDEYKDVRFEITKIMYDNIDYFQKQFAELIAQYVDLTVKKLCEGESYDMGTMFSSKLNERMQVAELKKQINHIMELVNSENCRISDKNKFVLLGFFAHIKHKFGNESWKEFFAGKREHLTVFVEYGAKTILTGYGIKPFDPPANWGKEDLAEFVALLEASTENKAIGNVCLRYIYQTTDIDWEKLGITKTKHRKTIGAQKHDIEKIHSMLRRVGYEPYQNGKYTDLINVVHNDLEASVSPLLITRTLDTFYQWQKCYGNQVRAKELALKLRECILEMRKTQKPLYNYMIPKLALEIIESQSHYHETIINTETMYDAFWNWFLIGYKKCKNDDIALNYTRVYQAIAMKISRLPVRKKLRAAFKDQQ